jgi:hypothetical protein
MISIITKDGATFQAADAAGLVAAMHQASQSPEASDQAWMEAAAGRAAQQTGNTVSTVSPEAFLTDLALVGLIERGN